MAKGTLTPEERLFCGVFITGIGWADRSRERHGDYAKLAFMSFATLEVHIESDCPKELSVPIEAAVKEFQARRGQEFQTSGSGQTITLGYLNSCKCLGGHALSQSFQLLLSEVRSRRLLCGHGFRHSPRSGKVQVRISSGML